MDWERNSVTSCEPGFRQDLGRQVLTDIGPDQHQWLVTVPHQWSLCHSLCFLDAGPAIGHPSDFPAVQKRPREERGLSRCDSARATPTFCSPSRCFVTLN